MGATMTVGNPDVLLNKFRPSRGPRPAARARALWSTVALVRIGLLGVYLALRPLGAIVVASREELGARRGGKIRLCLAWATHKKRRPTGYRRSVSVRQPVACVRGGPFAPWPPRPRTTRLKSLGTGRSSPSRKALLGMNRAYVNQLDAGAFQRVLNRVRRGVADLHHNKFARGIITLKGA